MNQEPHRKIRNSLTKIACALISSRCGYTFCILMTHRRVIDAIFIGHAVDAVAMISWVAFALIAFRWGDKQALSVQTAIVLNMTRRWKAGALLNAIADIAFRAQAKRHALNVVPLANGILSAICSATETGGHAAANKY